MTGAGHCSVPWIDEAGLELRHDLANVALALDAIAEALTSGAATPAAAARLVRTSSQRLNDLAENVGLHPHDDAR